MRLLSTKSCGYFLILGKIGLFLILKSGHTVCHIFNLRCSRRLDLKKSCNNSLQSKAEPCLFRFRAHLFRHRDRSDRWNGLVGLSEARTLRPLCR